MQQKAAAILQQPLPQQTLPWWQLWEQAALAYPRTARHQNQIRVHHHLSQQPHLLQQQRLGHQKRLRCRHLHLLLEARRQ